LEINQGYTTMNSQPIIKMCKRMFSELLHVRSPSTNEHW